jgi:LAO/AO transport system kinase
VRVLKTIASSGDGVPELLAYIDKHREWLLASGQWAVRERLRAAHTLENILRAEVTQRILARLPHDGLDELLESLQRRQNDPYSAARRLIAGW